MSAAGEVVTGLGIEVQLGAGDLISSGILLLRVVQEDGSVTVHTAWSEDLERDWVARRGMLEMAVDAERVSVNTEDEE